MARVVGHDLVVEEHDALGAGTHQDHPADGSRVEVPRKYVRTRRSRRGTFASFSRISVKTSTNSSSFGTGWTPYSYFELRLGTPITLRTAARDKIRD